MKFFFIGGASGFGWDEGTKTVTAPDSVWEDFIAVRQLCILPLVYRANVYD